MSKYQSRGGEDVPDNTKPQPSKGLLSLWTDWALPLKRVIREARKRVGKPGGEPPERRRLS